MTPSHTAFSSDFDLQDALAYQHRILPHVSRTFALSIPRLPLTLRQVVANAYLLCRIADTIEDEPALETAQKQHYQAAFSDAVMGRCDPQALATELAPLLTGATSEAERDLVAHSALVLHFTSTFDDRQRAAIERCLRIMSSGMSRFERNVGLPGLPDLQALDEYCYVVAGVVGEMLTDLFCAHAPEAEARREQLYPRSVSFGQGLQMTNILKDVWDDRRRQVCWFPRDVFSRHGIALERLEQRTGSADFLAAMEELIGLAHAHLREAMEYTLTIPSSQGGIRQFCAWNIGMALLTLRKIASHPDYRSGSDVKISRRAVGGSFALTRAGIHSNTWLRRLFDLTAMRLPLQSLPGRNIPEQNPRA